MQRSSFRTATRIIFSLTLAAFLILGSVGQASAAGVIYVKYNATGANNGTSWGNAYVSLQVALSKAVSGNQVWVAKGTYKPATGACTVSTKEPQRRKSFVLKNGVTIYGGFAGTETAVSQRNVKLNVTYLDGNICAGTLSNDNSYHVVRGTTNSTGIALNSTAILDGFTIKNGNANGTFFSGQPRSGGGIYLVKGSSPTLRNLVVTLNGAADIGGAGMYSEAGSNAKLTNVTFSYNTATNVGGGMYNLDSSPVLSNVRFVGNHANSSGGGGMYNNNSKPKLTNVTFKNNTAQVQGGGMYNDFGSRPTLTQVTFIGNTAATGGGMVNDASSPVLTNVVFSANHSTNTSDGGGGMYNNNGSAPTVRNVTFNANTAVNGGALYNNNGSNPRLQNVTIRANTATGNGGGIANQDSSPMLNNVTLTANTAAAGDGIYTASSGVTISPQIYNSILWGDGATSDEIFDADTFSVPTIDHSIVQGGCPADLSTTCTNVINSDPVLGTLKKIGYTKMIPLGLNSAAVDAGGGIKACVAKDQRNMARPQGIACDLGAYEVKAMAFTSVSGYDGQVVESGTGTGLGGSVNNTSSLMKVGDDGSNRQIRAFLSFDTSALPDTAVIVLARPKVDQQTLSGTPFDGSLGNLQVELKKPYFGAGPGLAATDFNVAATLGGNMDPTPDPAGWYRGWLASGLTVINLTGTTQLRLRFATAATVDNSPDYLAFYSGNVSTVANRPVLYVYYNP